MLDPRRVRAMRELRAMARPYPHGGVDGDPEDTREKLQRIISGLTCCERDIDGDGNCPKHPAFRRM